jgi:hypothetical protein
MNATTPDLFNFMKKKTSLDIAIENADKLSEEFLDWLPENMHIFDAFAENARNIIARGYKHYSSRTIVEFLRHHTALQESGGTWKINDHNVPYLGRLFDLVYPHMAGLFEYRVTTKNKAATHG